eukprot:554880_1
MNSINFKSEVSIQRKGSKTMSLQEILKDKHGFNEFARYLTFCWSLENLLFFVETNQWLLSLFEKEEYCELKVDKRQLLDVEISELAPKSKIIELKYTNSDCDKLFDEYLQCVHIFKKYVINGSYFCINISFVNRDYLYKQFGGNEKATDEEMVKYLCDGNITREKIVHIFDECRSEIFQLLLFAFSRFKCSHEYNEYIDKKVAQSDLV